jgi:hypothetical protein
MSCNRCANQAEAAMSEAGVPPGQAQATWAGDGRYPQCSICGAFLTRQGLCGSVRCALQRLLDVPALNRDDLDPDDAQTVEIARATLSWMDAQTAQIMRILKEAEQSSLYPLAEVLKNEDPATDMVIRDYYRWREEMSLAHEDDVPALRYRVATLGITLRRIAREIYGIDWRELR